MEFDFTKPIDDRIKEILNKNTDTGFQRSEGVRTSEDMIYFLRWAEVNTKPFESNNYLLSRTFSEAIKQYRDLGYQKLRQDSEKGSTGDPNDTINTLIRQWQSSNNVTAKKIYEGAISRAASYDIVLQRMIDLLKTTSDPNLKILSENVIKRIMDSNPALKEMAVSLLPSDTFQKESSYKRLTRKYGGM